MRIRVPNGVTRPLLIVAVAVGLLSGACQALEKVDQQDLSGPSETGISVQLIALADTVNADGVSTVDVELVLRDNTGGPVVGLAVYFLLDDSQTGGGLLDPKTGFTYVGPVQSGFVMATNNNGVARVVYTAGFAVGGRATIGVRPYGIDGLVEFYRTVDIQQK
jgi:hypothetical protein